MDPALLRLLVVAGVIAVAVLAGRWWQRRGGEVEAREGDGRFGEGELASVGLDGHAGVRALLLSSPTCAPCRTVREVLARVEDERDGFAWVSIDAAEHLDLAQEHHVMRVPTLFVIDADGRIVARTSGVPATHDLVRLVDRVAEPA